VAMQFKRAAFGEETFEAEDLFKIFRNKLENETVAFSGSPLKGVQILGVLETRALNFGHVLVLDANESILPKLKIREPLIPRDVMISLGLDRLEKEEEIQRYQFSRLIASAGRVDLFYAESEEHHRSRFVEDLVWARKSSPRCLAWCLCGGRNSG
jgi:ATP-dependent helicase/nuclease subunit B